MSLEQNFLDIYRVVLDQGLEEFYSSDVSEQAGLNPGTVGRTLYGIVETYDVPITVERESPGAASCFSLDERMGFEEMEEVLENEDSQGDELPDPDDVAERLDEGHYTDNELNSELYGLFQDRFKNIGSRVSAVAEVKEELEGDVINGNSIDGWTVGDQQSRK